MKNQHKPPPENMIAFCKVSLSVKLSKRTAMENDRPVGYSLWEKQIRNTWLRNDTAEEVRRKIWLLIQGRKYLAGTIQHGAGKKWVPSSRVGYGNW